MTLECSMRLYTWHVEHDVHDSAKCLLQYKAQQRSHLMCILPGPRTAQPPVSSDHREHRPAALELELHPSKSTRTQQMLVPVFNACIKHGNVGQPKCTAHTTFPKRTKPMHTATSLTTGPNQMPAMLAHNRTVEPRCPET